MRRIIFHPVFCWLAMAALFCFTACRQTDPSHSKTKQPSSGSSSTNTPSPATKQNSSPSADSKTTSPKRSDSSTSSSSSRKPVINIETKPSERSQVDKELDDIITLARANKWGEAEKQADALLTLYPDDSSVLRVQKWVKTEGPKQKEKELEGQIRDVVARDTRFNPTLGSIIKDPKIKKLPPRSDLREAIEQINATPLIPDTFNKTLQAKGTLTDFRLTPPGRMSELLDKQIPNLVLNDVSLHDIILTTFAKEKVNLAVDEKMPALQRKLKINAQNVKIKEFMSYVSQIMGLQFQIGDNLIWITDSKDTNKVARETRFYQLRQGLILPAQMALPDAQVSQQTAPNNIITRTEVQTQENFVPDYAAKEPAIAKAIASFFRGSNYYIDMERNLIMAQGNSEQLDELEQIIEAFDKPVRQVLIEARFITVTEATFLQLGAAWETGRSAVGTARTAKDNTGLAEGGVGLGLEQTWSGVLSRQGLSATMTAIEQSGESETLSSPRVALINNLPSTISDGQIRYYYEQYTIESSKTERTSVSTISPVGRPTKVTAGVSLDVLASIGGDGKSILLALHPKVSAAPQMVTFATVSDRDSLGRIASSFDIKLPQTQEQSLSTRVVVKSGQTVIMGGVMQREQRTFVESVPVLSRIPLLGAAFRRRTEIDRPRYLLIFVTATLLSEDGKYIINPDTR